jgi:hypothetical protein
LGGWGGWGGGRFLEKKNKKRGEAKNLEKKNFLKEER